MTPFAEEPRALRDPAVRVRRIELLAQPHMLGLQAYLAELRQSPGTQVPDFDPLDGGTAARMLFLFEKPGPMAAEHGRRKGSGFISRDNDDPTAEATFHFMRAAAIPREVTLLWNLVPWWNGTRQVRAAELRRGVSATQQLLLRLPALQVIVLVGRKAGAAKPNLSSESHQIFESLHTSPLVRARWPEAWAAIPEVWRQAYDVLGSTALQQPQDRNSSR